MAKEKSTVHRSNRIFCYKSCGHPDMRINRMIQIQKADDLEKALLPQHKADLCLSMRLRPVCEETNRTTASASKKNARETFFLTIS
jgi:hypothetical protein